MGIEEFWDVIKFYFFFFLNETSCRGHVYETGVLFLHVVSLTNSGCHSFYSCVVCLNLKRTSVVLKSPLALDIIFEV